MKKGLFKLAKFDFEKTSKLEPTNVVPYYWLGLLDEKMNLKKLAENDLKKGMGKNTFNPFIQFHLAYLKRKRKEEALFHLKQGI